MSARIKCPFCYAYSRDPGGPSVSCDDCLRAYSPVRLGGGPVSFDLDGRRYRVVEDTNHVIYPVRHGFAHESFRHPDLDVPRRRYRLDRIARPWATEFEQQLALRDWVCAQWTSGMPSVPNPEPGPPPDWHVGVMLAKSRAKGNCYFCTYKAMACVELASAFGWTARLVNIMYHMVYEMWSNQWNKWVLCDSLFNVHYEKDGVPLSAWEIRREQLRNRGRRVRLVWGVRRHDLGTPRCDWFEWFVIYMHNNFFDFLPGDHIHPLLMPRDRYNQGKFWRQDRNIGRKRGNVYVCKGMVSEESDPRHIDYPINQTEVFLTRREHDLLVRFQHTMPNYSHIEARIGAGRWRRFEQWRAAEMPWRPGNGRSRLEARCVNTRGVAGPVSRIVVEPM